jgi:hypothetical protein
MACGRKPGAFTLLALDVKLRSAACPHLVSTPPLPLDDRESRNA